MNLNKNHHGANVKIIAHYLPQFHRIKENSNWWGEGFTEWTNVAKAKPLFDGHYQPHIPKDLGFYDLSFEEPIREQAKLAKEYGVDGFNFYFYWFDEKRLLEKPLENFLASDIPFEFCLTWANENWTRRWDGADKDVLMPQNYRKGFEEPLFDCLLPYFNDPRYIKIDGKPVLSVYRLQELPDPIDFATKLRRFATQSGFPGVHIVAVASFGLTDPEKVGADALMEFPPHGIGAECQIANPDSMQSGFSGAVLDYREVVRQSIMKAPSHENFYRGIMTGWDNSPRTGLRSHVFINSSPQSFGAWLRYLLAWSHLHSSPFVFVNAWNEWAEGAHLEPDLLNGSRLLEEVQRAKNSTLLESGDYTNEVLREIDLTPNHLLDEPNRSVTEIGKQDETIWQLVVRALKIARSDPSLFSLFRSVARYMRKRLDKRSKTEVGHVLSDIAQGLPRESKVRVLVTFHIHYSEALNFVYETMEKFPPETRFVLTTSQDSVFEMVNSRKGFSTLEAMKVPNRGRNVSPLVVDLANTVMESDVLFHFHSKRSTHSARSIAEQWNDSLWSSISSSPQVIDDIVKILSTESGFGVAYLNPETFISKSSIGWHASRDLGISWLSSKGINTSMEPFSFPAGGMFAARTDSLKQLFEHQWKLEDFPLEMGQVDGQTHHMIERLFGYLPFVNGFRHLLLPPEKGEVVVLNSSTTQD
jgi:lipopolysaccharide biosynthesis protein